MSFLTIPCIVKCPLPNEETNLQQQEEKELECHKTAPTAHTQKKSVIDKIEKAETTKKVLEKFPFLNKETAVSKNKFSSSKCV